MADLSTAPALSEVKKMKKAPMARIPMTRVSGCIPSSPSKPCACCPYTHSHEEVRNDSSNLMVKGFA